MLTAFLFLRENIFKKTSLDVLQIQQPSLSLWHQITTAKAHDMTFQDLKPGTIVSHTSHEGQSSFRVFYQVLYRFESRWGNRVRVKNLDTSVISEASATADVRPEYKRFAGGWQFEKNSPLAPKGSR